MVNRKKRFRVKIPPFILMLVTVTLIISLIYGLSQTLKRDGGLAILGSSISTKTFPSPNPDYQIKIYTEKNRDKTLTAVFPFFDKQIIDERIRETIDQYSDNLPQSDIDNDKIDYQIGVINENLISLNLLTRNRFIPIVFNRVSGEVIRFEDIVIGNEDNILNHSRFIGRDIVPLLSNRSEFFINLDYNFVFFDQGNKVVFDITELDSILNKSTMAGLIPNYNEILQVKKTAINTERKLARKNHLENILESQKDIDCNIDKCIALTFDSGPSEKTLDVLEVLNQENVLGTFYVVGNEIYNRSDIFQKTVDLGHEIGNQTWSYPNITEISNKQIVDEIDRNNEIIWNIAGIAPLTFRPPFGAINDEDIQYIDGQIIDWDVDSLDWKAASGSQITEKILAEIENGDIVLLHDTNEFVVDSLGDLIPKLRALDYEFVTVSKLIQTNGLDNTL